LLVDAPGHVITPLPVADLFIGAGVHALFEFAIGVLLTALSTISCRRFFSGVLFRALLGRGFFAVVIIFAFTVDAGFHALSTHLSAVCFAFAAVEAFSEPVIDRVFARFGAELGLGLRVFHRRLLMGTLFFGGLFPGLFFCTFSVDTALNPLTPGPLAVILAFAALHTFPEPFFGGFFAAVGAVGLFSGFFFSGVLDGGVLFSGLIFDGLLFDGLFFDGLFDRGLFGNITLWVVVISFDGTAEVVLVVAGCIAGAGVIGLTNFLDPFERTALHADGHHAEPEYESRSLSHQFSPNCRCLSAVLLVNCGRPVESVTKKDFSWS
jgi:hypothetical protein